MVKARGEERPHIGHERFSQAGAACPQGGESREGERQSLAPCRREDKLGGGPKHSAVKSVGDDQAGLLGQDLARELGATAK